jgi:hypothetical protein
MAKQNRSDSTGNYAWLVQTLAGSEGRRRALRSDYTPTKHEPRFIATGDSELPDLGTSSDEELLALLKRLEAIERRLSFHRRVLHGKIDIVLAELMTRGRVATTGR